MKTIEEKNRMIAEFLGYKLIDSDFDLYETPECMYDIRDDAGDMNTKPSVREMCFNTNWNWLMPVVEKISKLGFEFQIDPNETYFKENDGDYEIVASAFNGSVLENTYEAVVQFIEWYNENK